MLDSLNLGTTILLFFLFCADTVERERLAHYTPFPTYIGFRSYFLLLCAAVLGANFTITEVNSDSSSSRYEHIHLVSCALLDLSWAALWIHYQPRISLGLGITSLVCACFYFALVLQSRYLYIVWPLFLMFHTFATFRFAQEHHETRFGSRQTSRIDNPGTRANADAYVLPVQNPHLLVAETKQEQYEKLAAERLKVDK